MKVKLPVIIFVFLISIFTFFTFSQTLDTTPAAEPEEEIACEEIEMMLDNIILELKLTNNQNSQYYQVLLTRLNFLSSKAKILGYDTAILDNNILSLKTQITNFDTKADLLVQKVDSARLYACSEIQSVQYDKSIAEGRRALRDLVAETEKISMFFDNELNLSVSNLGKGN